MTSKHLNSKNTVLLCVFLFLSHFVFCSTWNWTWVPAHSWQVFHTEPHPALYCCLPSPPLMLKLWAQALSAVWHRLHTWSCIFLPFAKDIQGIVFNVWIYNLFLFVCFLVPSLYDKALFFFLPSLLSFLAKVNVQEHLRYLRTCNHSKFCVLFHFLA